MEGGESQFVTYRIGSLENKMTQDVSLCPVTYRIGGLGTGKKHVIKKTLWNKNRKKNSHIPIYSVSYEQPVSLFIQKTTVDEKYIPSFCL